MTNNLAEFCALAFGLEKLTDFMDKDGFTPRLLSVYGDSMLVVNIMNKKWRAKEDKPYSPGYEHAIKVLRKLRKAGVKVTFDWIPREQNQECDDLSNAHEA